MLKIDQFEGLFRNMTQMPENNNAECEKGYPSISYPDSRLSNKDKNWVHADSDRRKVRDPVV